MPFHLYRYVDEEVFRFNYRRDGDGDSGRFRRKLGAIADRRTDYKTLTGKVALA